MQRVHESEERSGHTPPPPYTLVDQFTDGSTTQTQQHSQNTYSENSPDSDFRLAQKLQDEEYARWAESNRQQDLVSNVGESSVDHFHSRVVPPIPENYRSYYQLPRPYPYYNNYQTTQPQTSYHTIDDDDNTASGCLTGLYERDLRRQNGVASLLHCATPNYVQNN
ncbi:12704_t:CDS:2 [Cetraspora pellucida]|uniref:12704_t:CDS:1 n=1 Tax=Cetraspora pellucida TaxID=1433469 RepID=A0A9N9BM33_9GLOM|nr:12704_t:CDS:2 [Cetraspora pellucida]